MLVTSIQYSASSSDLGNTQKIGMSVLIMVGIAALGGGIFMIGRYIKIAVIVNLLVFFLPSRYSFALENSSAKELMQSVVEQGRTNTEKVDILMTLVDKEGKTWNRTGRFYTKKKDAQNDMRLFYFFTPAELADSGVLTIENFSGMHDQWLYIPAYHTARRIASGNRSEKYMGTDFFYEDIISIKVEEYDMKILRKEKLNAIEAVVLEAIPISKKLKQESAYSKTIWWIDSQKSVALKAEYYDKDGEFLKVLENSDLQFLKGYYLWGRQIMKDVQNNHQTIIEYKNRKVDESISSDIFTLRYLKRRR
jgi:hypothetical protein